MRFRRFRTVARALAMGAATVLVISLITFAATSMRSPDVVAISTLGLEAATPELIQAFIEDRGLDRPAAERYWEWITGVVKGDFGVSLTTDRPVADSMLPRFRRTVELTILSLGLGVAASVAFGVYLAGRAGTRREVALMSGTVGLAALPEFVKGVLLMVIFSVYLGWLPVESSGLSFGSAWDGAKAYILPVMTVSLHLFPYIVRMTHAAAREAFEAPHTRMAVLLGIRRQRVIWTYAMRPAAIPLVNAVALNMMSLLGGVIVVENVFGFPGVGQLLVSAIHANDTPTVQAITVVLGALFISISIVADVVGAYLNPRLKGT